jgi:hypothetical protein
MFFDRGGILYLCRVEASWLFDCTITIGGMESADARGENTWFTISVFRTVNIW